MLAKISSVIGGLWKQTLSKANRLRLSIEWLITLNDIILELVLAKLLPHSDCTSHSFKRSLKNLESAYQLGSISILLDFLNKYVLKPCNRAFATTKCSCGKDSTYSNNNCCTSQKVKRTTYSMR